MADRTLRTLCCAEWQFYHSTWLRGLPPVCFQAEEIQKNLNISGAYLEKCTWGDTYSLRYPVSLNSLERRSLGCPMDVL
jgi:hypothetical protein